MSDRQFLLVLLGFAMAAAIFYSGMVAILTTDVMLIRDNLLIASSIVCLSGAIVGANIMCVGHRSKP